jgi:hypothetical protein
MEMRTALMHALREEKLTPAEREAACAILIDLQNALSGL